MARQLVENHRAAFHKLIAGKLKSDFPFVRPPPDNAAVTILQFPARVCARGQKQRRQKRNQKPSHPAPIFNRSPIQFNLMVIFSQTPSKIAAKAISLLLDFGRCRPEKD